MVYKFEAMPDCCWKYLKGTNQEIQDLELLKRVLMAAFNDSWGDAYSPPQKLPGAIMFCGAYGGSTIAAHMMGGDDEGVTDEAHVKKNVEILCKFFEEEKIGDVVELPEYHNALHNSTIIPIMICIKHTEFKKTMKRWAKEMGKSWKLKIEGAW